MTTYTDDFTGTDGTTLIGSTAANGNTFQGSGAWVIDANHAKPPGSGGNVELVVDYGAADVDISVTHVDTPSPGDHPVGLALRWASSGSTLMLEVATSPQKSFLYVNDSTLLGSWDHGVADLSGHVSRVVITGDTYDVYMDGSLIGTASSSYNNTETRHGLYNFNNVARLDDLTVTIADAPPGPVATITELFFDDDRLQSSTATPARGTVTKDASNPLLETGTSTATWDYQKNFVGADLDGSTIRLYYGAIPTDYASVNDLRGAVADSTDGVTFTKPIVGAYSYASSTANNLVTEDFLVTGRSIDGVWYLVTAWHAAGNGIFILSDTDPHGSFSTLEATISDGEVEGIELVKLPDGTWMAFGLKGQSGQARTMYAWTASALGGSWSGPTTTNLAATDSAHQFYGLNIAVVDRLLVGTVWRYNHSTEMVYSALWTSRDGISWTEQVDTLVVAGASGAWDDSGVYGTRLVEVGENWHFYYNGVPELHNHAPVFDARIGRASVTRERLGGITDGDLVTWGIIPAAGARLRVNSSGTIGMEVQDNTGTPLTGFTAADFDGISTDATDHTPTWGGLPMPTGSELFLRFIVGAGAHLYAYEVGLTPPKGTPGVVEVAGGFGAIGAVPGPGIIEVTGGNADITVPTTTLTTIHIRIRLGSVSSPYPNGFERSVDPMPVPLYELEEPATLPGDVPMPLWRRRGPGIPYRDRT